MANRRFYQFLYSKVPMLTFIEGSVVIGATGAVGTVTGAGVTGVTRLTTGIYQIQLADTYNALVGVSFLQESGITGANVTDGAFVTGTQYQITALGTTNWSSVGLATGLTAAIGQVFVATGAGGSGGGTAKAITPSGIVTIEVPQNPQLMLNGGAANGGYVIFNTLNVSDALANPVSGCRLRFALWLRNSSNTY